MVYGSKGRLVFPIPRNRGAGGVEVPVASGLDFGHMNPIMTLPVVVEAEMDPEKGALSPSEPGVR